MFIDRCVLRKYCAERPPLAPHNASGRVVASLVMLTTIPLLASGFAVVTGAAAAAGVRRVLATRNRFPEGGYRLVIGLTARFCVPFAPCLWVCAPI
jgi:hypothetical protein